MWFSKFSVVFGLGIAVAVLGVASLLAPGAGDAGSDTRAFDRPAVATAGSDLGWQ
ncbi:MULTISPECIES: hypothetical protein [unclassified Streptomyces]|uniref:hypothetical protein n=1 Tax=unclassified Streptomyces TaxID=2593676 RepID=UPI003813786E